MVVIYLIFISHEKYNITIPPLFITLLVRFVAIFLMHMQVSPQLTQGLAMMKFLMNHPGEFIHAGLAFSVGFFSFVVTAATEFACVCLLSTITDTMDCIIKQIALASIAKAAIHYAAAYNESSKIKM